MDSKSEARLPLRSATGLAADRPGSTVCSNEAASLGTLWVNLVVVSGGMGSLIYSELRYRSPVGSASDDVGVDELALSPVS